MSLTRPLGAARSDRQREREAVLRRTRDAVKQRSGDMCEFTACPSRGSDLAHLYRRGNRVGQPLCDHPTLCAWLCRSHHDLVDQRRLPTTTAELLWAGELERAAAEDAIDHFGFAAEATRQCVTLWSLSGNFPVDAVRWLERRLRETGKIRGRQWSDE